MLPHLCRSAAVVETEQCAIRRLAVTARPCLANKEPTMKGHRLRCGHTEGTSRGIAEYAVLRECSERHAPASADPNVVCAPPSIIVHNGFGRSD